MRKRGEAVLSDFTLPERNLEDHRICSSTSKSIVFPLRFRLNVMALAGAFSYQLGVHCSLGLADHIVVPKKIVVPYP